MLLATLQQTNFLLEMSNTLQLRPRFRYWSLARPDELTECLTAHQQLFTDTLQLVRRRHFVVISFLPHHRRVWSPQLTLEIEPEGKGSLVRGLFAPNASIWTFFMFLYGGLGTLGVFTAMIGAAQLTVGHTPWAFGLFAFFALALLVTYLANQYGKSRAKEQMEYLKTFLVGALGNRLQTEEEHTAAVG